MNCLYGAGPKPACPRLSERVNGSRSRQCASKISTCMKIGREREKEKKVELREESGLTCCVLGETLLNGSSRTPGTWKVS
ncbi:MAG: hypothetical protein ACFFCS_12670 [Candidatus Hodarchaeota archaeon]